MSEEDNFSRHIEAVAAEMGIDARCRLMHRSGFECDGEWFPPYDEYEVRADGKVLTFDAGFAAAAAAVGAEVVKDNLEGAFLR